MRKTKKARFKIFILLVMFVTVYWSDAFANDTITDTLDSMLHNGVTFSTHATKGRGTTFATHGWNVTMEGIGATNAGKSLKVLVSVPVNLAADITYIMPVSKDYVGGSTQSIEAAVMSKYGSKSSQYNTFKAIIKDEFNLHFEAHIQKYVKLVPTGQFADTLSQALNLAEWQPATQDAFRNYYYNFNQPLGCQAEPAKGSLTVKFIDWDSRSIIKTLPTETDLIMGTYTRSAPKIANYNIVNNYGTVVESINQSATLSAANPDQEIDFYYKSSYVPGVIVTKYRQIVDGVETTITDPTRGNTIPDITHQFDMSTTTVDETYAAQYQKSIEGYKFTGHSPLPTINSNNTSGTITYYYQPLPTLGSVTEQYIDANTLQVLKVINHPTVPIGTPTYIYNSSYFPTYMLKDPSTANQTITVEAGKSYLIKYYMVKQPTTGDVTVQYIDSKTNNILFTDGKRSETPGLHTYNPTAHTGYTLVDSTSQTVNVVAGQSYIIKFYLTKDPTTASVIIQYIEQSTNNILFSDSYPSETPGSHTYSPVAHAGYTLVDSTPQTIAVVAGQSYIVKFYIKKDLPASVVIQYILQGSSNILFSDNITNETPGSHTYSPVAHAGYTLVDSTPQTITVVAGQNYFVKFYLTKDPTTASVIINYIDQDTGNNLADPDNIIETPGSHTYNAKSFDGYDLVGSNSQTITVEVGKSYVVTFNYKKQSGSTGNAPDTPVVQINKPPTASIYNDPKSYEENEVRINSGAWDEDGTVVGYEWNVDGNADNNISGDKGNVTWHDSGTYGIQLTVTDDQGATGQATSSIQIMPAIPIANFKLDGTRKVNRKLVIDTTLSYSPSSGLPVLADQNEIEIIPVTSGITAADIMIDTDSPLDHRAFIVKKAGDYKIRLKVHNAKHESSWYEKVYTINPDLPPKADFILNKKFYRDPINNSNMAEIDVFNNSASYDEDKIGKQILYYKFDANNDGSFTDEDWITVPDDSFDISNNVWKVNVANLGKYLFKLYVEEDFTNDTIPKFITQDDIKCDDTVSNSKTVADTITEVDNIAPAVDYDVINKKNIDVVIVTDYTGSKLANLQAKLQSAKAALLNNNVILNYYIQSNKTTIATQTSQVPVYQYARYYRLTYYKTGSETTNGTQTNFSNAPVEMDMTYEQATLNEGQPLPAFQKPNNMQYHLVQSNASYQGIGWCYIYDQYQAYDPSDFANTRIDFQITTQMSSGSYWTAITYGLGAASLDNKWNLVSVSNQNQTNNYESVDMSGLANLNMKQNTDKYVLVVSDNDKPNAYRTWGNYYSFGTLNKGTIGNFVQSNKCNVYAVVPQTALDLKLNKTANNLSTNAPQDLTINELLNLSPKEQLTYSQGSYAAAIDHIVSKYSSNAQKKVDVVVSTDYTGSKLTDLNTQLSSLKTTLQSSSVDLNYTINTDKVKTQTITYTTGKLSSSSGSKTLVTSDGKLLYWQSTSTGPILNRNDVYTAYPVTINKLKDTPGNWYNSAQSAEYNISQYASAPILIDTNVKDASLCGNFLIYLKNDGTAYVKGNLKSNYYDPDNYTIKQISGLPKVKRLIISDMNGCAFFIGEDDLLYVMTASCSYACYSDYNSAPTFAKDGFRNAVAGVVNGLSNIKVKDIVTDSQFFAALTLDGHVYTWGEGSFGRLGTGGTKDWSNNNSPGYVSYYPNLVNLSGVTSIAANNEALYMSTSLGLLYFCGLDGYEIKGNYYGYVKPLNPFVDKNSVQKYNNAYWTWDSNYNPVGCTYYYTGYPTQLKTGTDIMTGVTGLKDISYGSSYKEYSIIRNGYVYYTSDYTNTQLTRWFYQTINSYTYQQQQTYSTMYWDAYNRLFGEGYQKVYIENFNPLSLQFAALKNDGTIYDDQYTNQDGNLQNYYGITYAASIAKLNSVSTVDKYSMDLDVLQQVPLRADADHYFLYATDSNGSIDNDRINYFSLSSLPTTFTDYLKNNNIQTDCLTPLDDLAEPNIQTLLGIRGSGDYSSLLSYITNIKNRYFILQNDNTLTIYLLLNDSVLYKYYYSDFENDPQYAMKVKYSHNPNVFENNQGLADFSDQWLSSTKSSFDKVGEYITDIEVQDSPTTDDTFANYRYWSQPPKILFKIIVHRPPVPQFNVVLNSQGSYFNDVVIDSSYDLDHLSYSDKGIKTKVWSWKLESDSNWTPGMLPSTLQINQNYFVRLDVTDYEGDTETLIKPVSTVISGSSGGGGDTTAPTLSISPTSRAWDKTDVSLTISASDSGSGVKTIMYAITNSSSMPSSDSWIINDITPQASASVYATISQEGTWYLHAIALDAAGNSVYTYAGTYNVDKTPPALLSVNVSTPSGYINGNDIWIAKNYNVVVTEKWTDINTAANSSGNKLIYAMTQKNAAWYSGIYHDTTQASTWKSSSYYTQTDLTASSANRTLNNPPGETDVDFNYVNNNSGEIDYPLYVQAQDNANNATGWLNSGLTIRIDNTAPIISLSSANGSIQANSYVNITTSDNRSGVKETWYMWANNNTNVSNLTGFTKLTGTQIPTPSTEGTYYLHVKSFDNVGNVNYSIYGSYTVSLLSVAATVTPNPAKQGQKITLTITTTGYAKFLTVYFPVEITSLDPSTPITVQIPEQQSRVDTITYYLPLKTPVTLDKNNNRVLPAYTLQVKAQKADGTSKITNVSLDVKGSVLDGLKTEIKGN